MENDFAPNKKNTKNTIRLYKKVLSGKNVLNKMNEYMQCHVITLTFKRFAYAKCMIHCVNNLRLCSSNKIFHWRFQHYGWSTLSGRVFFSSLKVINSLKILIITHDSYSVLVFLFNLRI